jgi:hypothetical protein
MADSPEQIPALLYLSMDMYEQALSSAKESSDSRAIGAGVLAASTLAEQSQDLVDKERLYLDAVELAANCKEDIPRAMASFDAWWLGMTYLTREETKKAWALFNEGVTLGYGTTLPLGNDGLLLCSGQLGLDAFKDDDAEEPDHELIQENISEWRKFKMGASLREVLKKLEISK